MEAFLKSHTPTRTHFLPSITFQSEAIMTNTRWTMNGSGAFFITIKIASGHLTDVHMRRHTKILSLSPCWSGSLERLTVTQSYKIKNCQLQYNCKVRYRLHKSPSPDATPSSPNTHTLLLVYWLKMSTHFSVSCVLHNSSIINLLFIRKICQTQFISENIWIHE